ncbi:G-protein coupled receptor 84-like [Acanthaster planci]|uniref:G-protein coupled receptor 84-like n=1 Tax=Acanthaster planci TaxID=133434 RepID=A0A8B7Z9I7_ACAPL|nr:G-protein coupled receptor 84-like [Acanthaster planci]
MEAPASIIVGLVLYISIILFGIPGNCLILRVYWVKKRKSSTHILILGLAWADLFSCIFLTLRVASAITYLLGDKPGTFLTFMHFLLQTAVATSVTLTGVIAFDRYDCICRSHRRLLSPKWAKVAFGCCLIYGASINIPFLVNIFRPAESIEALLYGFQILCYISALALIVFCYSKVYRTIRRHVQVGVWSSISTDGTRPELHNDSMNSARAVTPDCRGVEMKSVSHAVANNPGVSNLWKPSAPAACDSSVTGPGTARQRSELASYTEGPSDYPRRTHRTPTAGSGRDRRRPNRRPRLGGASSLQSKTTRMLLVTSVVFLIVWLPYWIWTILELWNTYSVWKVHDNVVQALSRMNTCLYLNNAINPILYGLANRRFRQDCRDSLRKIL